MYSLSFIKYIIPEAWCIESILLFYTSSIENFHVPFCKSAQSAEAAEDTNCITAEDKTPTPNECSVYNSKQSDGQALLGM